MADAGLQELVHTLILAGSSATAHGSPTTAVHGKRSRSSRSNPVRRQGQLGRKRPGVPIGTPRTTADGTAGDQSHRPTDRLSPATSRGSGGERLCQRYRGDPPATVAPVASTRGRGM